MMEQKIETTIGLGFKILGFEASRFVGFRRVWRSGILTREASAGLRRLLPIGLVVPSTPMPKS